MQTRSIELLNKSVADELAAVHQYMYFHFHCEDQGYEVLSKLFLKTAVEEMGHVEKCAERILFLGGDVEMAAAKGVEKVKDIKEMLQIGRSMEEGSIHDYNLWANECSANADAGTRKVFEGLVADEERHFGLFDLEIHKIEKYGPQYLVLQTVEGSPESAA